MDRAAKRRVGIRRHWLTPAGEVAVFGLGMALIVAAVFALDAVLTP